MEAGRALSGQVDGQSKQRDRTLPVASTSASSSASLPTGASVAGSSSHRHSPLTRILVCRLTEAGILLGQSGAALPLDDRSLTSASEEQLHLLTAQTALLCLELIHREKGSECCTNHSNGEGLIGARDQKTIQTLLLLVSSWGLEPALLSYDDAIDALDKAHSPSVSRLQELSEEREHKIAIWQTFHQSHKELADLFSAVASLLKSDETSARPLVPHGLIPTQLLTSKQPIAAHLLAAALRLHRAPQGKGHGTQASIQIIHEANTCLTFLLKSLPPTALLPMLSSVSSPRPAESSVGLALPPIPPVIRHLATRLLSAQLLRREGIVALVSSVMKIGEDSDEEQASSTLKLDRLATLLTIPPAGMNEDLFLSQHILPALLTFLVPSSSDGQASAVFAKVASYTLEKLVTCNHEEPVRRALEPLIWSTFGPTTSHCTSPPAALPSSHDLADALNLLEILVLYSTSVSSSWIGWLIQPIVTQVWDLLGVLESGSREKVRKVTTIDSGTTQFNQIKGVLQKWLEVSDAKEVMHIVRSWAMRQNDSGSRIYFELEKSGMAALRVGNAAPLQTEDLSSIIGKISLSPQQVSSDDDDEARARALLPYLQGMSPSHSGPSTSLFTTMLSQAGRSDLASALLPDLLEAYLLEKAQSTIQAWPHLQLILALLDTFGEALTKHKQEINNVLRFINICLGGRKLMSATRDEKVAEVEELPFIGIGGNGRKGDAMADLLGAGKPKAKEEVELAETHQEEEVDEDLIQTAVELLLSVLEGDPELAPSKVPLLRLIESVLPYYLLAALNEDVQRVVKEACLVLLAREQAISSNKREEELTSLGTPSSISRRAAQAKYEEALALLQDPILPVRAHGLVLLKEIAAVTEQRSASGHLLPPILDIVLRVIGDEESYLYLNAISALKEVILQGEPYLSQILHRYARSNDNPSRQTIDERLRIGEALLAAIQYWSEGGAVYLDTLLPVLLATLSDKGNSTTLKSSALTLLGTCVEAFPLALAGATRQGYVVELVRGCLDLLQLEMVRRSHGGETEKSRIAGASNGALEEDGGEDPIEQKRRLRFAPGADDSMSLDASYPQLRRGAILLLHLLIRGTRDQLVIFKAEQYGVSRTREMTTLTHLRLPGGGLLPSIVTQDNPPLSSSATAPSSSLLPPLLFPSPMEAKPTKGGNALHQSARNTLEYLHHEDDDALVRHMAGEAMEELDALKLDLINLTLGSLD